MDLTKVPPHIPEPEPQPAPQDDPIPTASGIVFVDGDEEMPISDRALLLAILASLGAPPPEVQSALLATAGVKPQPPRYNYHQEIFMRAVNYQAGGIANVRISVSRLLQRGAKMD